MGRLSSDTDFQVEHNDRKGYRTILKSSRIKIYQTTIHVSSPKLAAKVISKKLGKISHWKN